MLARAGNEGSRPHGRTFSSGHAAGLEDAIKLLDQGPPGRGLCTHQGGFAGQGSAMRSHFLT